MNIRYAPVQGLKSRIETALDLTIPLKIFTGWNPNGEAHVTTITPPEFDLVLKGFVAPERMNAIAREMRIQESDLEILGVGRGEATLDGKKEETYFLIVRSANLLKIRRAIHAEFVRNGGKASSWNPEHFFPHITIGFTKRDLHENDGVLKDVANSLDERFHLIVGD
ncbi:MAG: hypothetical protein NDI61_01710 [Bdellovibrionaceae bacterium]|nr:hypothetical protein [Pseudobdellovibrionaceae bacterium]